MDYIHDLSPPWSPGGQKQKASHAALFLHHSNVMTAHGRHAGSGQPGRTGPHHQDTPGNLRRLFIIHEIFPSHIGIDHTGTRFQGQNLVNAPQTAADTWPYGVQVSASCFFRKHGIGDQGTTHGHHVNPPLL
jgi:hypothetical protein